MKVKLVTVPDANSLDPKLDPPLGLMYLAAVLEQAEIDVEIVDLAFYEESEWGKALGEADIFGFGLFTPSYHLSLAALFLAKKNSPGCVSVAGGAHATVLPKRTLMDFDAVIMREGEFAFRHFVKKYMETGEYRPVTDGEIISNLDDLPFPARHLVPIKKYTRKLLGENATSIIHSRGCPYNCAYCCLAVSGHKLRFTSEKYLRAEVNQVRDNWGFDHFVFYDELINPNVQTFRQFCEVVKPLNIFFKCAGRTGIGGYEEYKMLRGAGGVEIAFGIESGCQRILNNLRKGTTVEKNKLSIKEAKKAGLIVKAYLMIGSPGESWESIQETIDFVKETEPHQYTLFNFVPQPGCDIYNNPEKHKIKIVNPNFQEWFYIGGQNIGGHPIATEFMTAAELEQARAFMLKQLGRPKVPPQDYYKKVKGEVYDE